MDKAPPVFEVKPFVKFDTVDKKWYAITALYQDGRQVQAELYKELPFNNMRRAKQFARFLADQQEQRTKRAVVEKLISLGVLPPMKEDNQTNEQP